MESSEFEEFYGPIVFDINELFTRKSGQFMLVGPDSAILDYAISELKSYQDYRFIEVKKDKDLSPDNKVFVIRLTPTTSIEYQSLLYYYFELPLHYDCFVCILTNCANALNFFEKRVMSRFKNKIFFFPYFRKETSTPSCKFEVIQSSIESKKQDELLNKYGMERYSLGFVLDLLEPIHFTLIMIAFAQKINITKVYDQFKQATVNTPELKRASSIRVLQCTFDIIECGCINEKGCPLIDFNEFKTFVSQNSPLYLKNLLRTVNLKK